VEDLNSNRVIVDANGEVHKTSLMTGSNIKPKIKRSLSDRRRIREHASKLKASEGTAGEG